MTRNEIVKSSIAGASLLLNIVLGIVTYQQSEKERDLALALKIETSKPEILQGRVILKGTVLKAMTEMGHSASLIENIPHPRFVENEVGAELYSIIEDTNEVRPLEGIVTEFITLRNTGDSVASNVRVRDESGDDLALGDAPPGVTFFLPVLFTRRQPFKESGIKSDYQEFEYQFVVLGESRTVRQDVRPRTTTSWIPSFDSMLGVGRALITEKNDHLLQEAQRE
jgi:hypothetical protein